MADATTVPVIASGGAGSPDHIVNLIRGARTDAVACASILHYNKYSLPEIKQRLQQEGCSVRP